MAIAEDAFEAWCTWNGFIGWSGRIMSVVGEIEEASS